MSVRIVVPTTIALPPWIMAASVFFCFCTSGPARLVAAWGCLVRLSQSLGTTSRWYKLTRLVVWVDACSRRSSSRIGESALWPPSGRSPRLSPRGTGPSPPGTGPSPVPRSLAERPFRRYSMPEFIYIGKQRSIRTMQATSGAQGLSTILTTIWIY